MKVTATGGEPVNRTKFIFDEQGRMIGRKLGDLIFTEAGNPSLPYVQTKRGLAVNKSHLRRVRCAKDA